MRVPQVMIPNFYSFDSSGGRALIPIMFAKGREIAKPGFKNLYTLTAYYGWCSNTYPVCTRTFTELELNEPELKKVKSERLFYG